MDVDLSKELASSPKSVLKDLQASKSEANKQMSKARVSPKWSKINGIEQLRLQLVAVGADGQPQLLVPVVLVMIFNRWNAILVPKYGFMHLELIPMLVGFFTYKIATFFHAIEEAISISTQKTDV